MIKMKTYLVLLLILSNLYLSYIVFTTVDYDSGLSIKKEALKVINVEKINYKKVYNKLKRLYNLHYQMDYSANIIIQESNIFDKNNLSNILTILFNNNINVKRIIINDVRNSKIHIKIISNMKEQ